MADYAVACPEACDIGADGVDFTSKVVAGDDRPLLDVEASLLCGIVGVYCDGVVADDDVVGTWRRDFSVGDAEGSVGRVNEG